jgi:dephospho-CoA kinase
LEENLECLVDGVLLVGTSEQNQIHRLAARNKYSEQEARARMAAQLSWEEKLTKANWLLDNSGDLSSLEEKVWVVWEQVCKDLLKS